MKRRTPTSLLGMVCLAVTAACGDDPVAPADRETPVQVRVEGAGLSLATATEFSNLGTGLAVAVGSRVDYDIVLLVEDPAASSPQPYDPASDEFLEVEIDNVGVARWEENGTGSFQGGLRGVADGSTNVVFRLIRGTPGSAAAQIVFQAFPIPITVAP